MSDYCRSHCLSNDRCALARVLLNLHKRSIFFFFTKFRDDGGLILQHSYNVLITILVCILLFLVNIFFYLIGTTVEIHKFARLFCVIPVCLYNYPDSYMLILLYSFVLYICHTNKFNQRCVSECGCVSVCVFIRGTWGTVRQSFFTKPF